MSDLPYLLRCADLADRADGRVGNSPRVGAVLVHQGRIIGEGLHHVAGRAHAEVNCLASVAAADRALVSQATLYVSLEPCCIAGRSGACTDLIRRHGIPTVVIGQRDATPGVAGRGVELLRAAGVTVREYPDFAPTARVGYGRRVMTERGRPHVTLKFARSADGFLRPARSVTEYWITNPLSRRAVHRQRARAAAILVGGRTVTDDDPLLNTRFFPGPSPRPVVLDPRDRVRGTERLFATDRAPLLFSGQPRPEVAAHNVVVGPRLDQAALTQVLGEVLRQGYGYLLVEGGTSVLRAFLEAGYWDECHRYTAPTRFGTGLPAPALPPAVRLAAQAWLRDDRLEVFHNDLPASLPTV